MVWCTKLHYCVVRSSWCNQATLSIFAQYICSMPAQYICSVYLQHACSNTHCCDTKVEVQNHCCEERVNLIGPYHGREVNPRNLTWFTRPFLGKRLTWSGQVHSVEVWQGVDFENAICVGRVYAATPRTKHLITENRGTPKSIDHVIQIG